MSHYFYEGIIIGLVLGTTLNLIKSYIFKNKSKNCHPKCIDGCLQREPNAPVKIDGEFKMALLVRHDLKMGKGKVAAQCSHAIVHCYEEGLRLKPKEIKGWELNNKPVDIFKVADEESMMLYQRLAIEEGINSYIVIDAGRTQVAPRSKTVMAIGPAKSEEIDLFIQSLKLQCAVVSINAFNKGKLSGLPSSCARVVLRTPDLKTLECIKKQCKLFGIQTASFTENGEETVLAVGPANEVSINAQVHNLKLF